MCKHFPSINNVGAGLAELIYEHLQLIELRQSIDVVCHLYQGIGH